MLSMADGGLCGKPKICHLNMVLWPMADIIGVAAYGG